MRRSKGPTVDVQLGAKGRTRATKRWRTLRELMGFAAAGGVNLGVIACWISEGNPFAFFAFVAYIGLALSLTWGYQAYSRLEA